MHDIAGQFQQQTGWGETEIAYAYTNQATERESWAEGDNGSAAG